MYLGVSKYLDVPAQALGLNNASASHMFYIIRGFSMGCFVLSVNVFLVLIYQTNMRVEKYSTMNNIVAVPVLISYTWKQRCFKVCFFFMTPFHKTLLFMLPF